MTAILLKLGIIASVGAVFTALLYSMPDAQPLPLGITAGIQWLVPKLYFFDSFFPVGIFYQCVGYMIQAFAWFILLKIMIKAMVWVFRVA